jgi:hypothetical protein
MADMSSRSSAAIEEAKSILASSSASIAVTYFYCTFDNIASHDPVTVLGSILVQLNAAIPSVLSDEKYGFHRGYQTLNVPSIDNLIYLINRHAVTMQRVYVFVDALNESNLPSSILLALQKLHSEVRNISIMITSTSMSLTEGIRGASNLLEIQMDFPSVQADIRTYVCHQVEVREIFRNLPLHIKEELQTVIPEKADGM